MTDKEIERYKAYAAHQLQSNPVDNTAIMLLDVLDQFVSVRENMRQLMFQTTRSVQRALGEEVQ